MAKIPSKSDRKELLERIEDVPAVIKMDDFESKILNALNSEDRRIIESMYVKVYAIKENATRDEIEIVRQIFNKINVARKQCGHNTCGNCSPPQQ